MTVEELQNFILENEPLLGQADLDAEQAKEVKQKLEKELLEEIPQWREARDQLTEANKTKKDLEARFRSAIDMIVQQGALPATKNVSVTASPKYTLTNQTQVVYFMIEELGAPAAHNLQLKPELTPEFLAQWGARYDEEVETKSIISWSNLRKLAKGE